MKKSGVDEVVVVVIEAVIEVDTEVAVVVEVGIEDVVGDDGEYPEMKPLWLFTYATLPALCPCAPRRLEVPRDPFSRRW